MAPSKTTASAERVEYAEDAIPRDYDPEDSNSPDDSDASVSEDVVTDDAAGRKHYVKVGESKLRKKDVVPLGPQYAGSRIDRNALVDEDDDDDPFAKSFSIESSEDEEDHEEDEVQAGSHVNGHAGQVEHTTDDEEEDSMPDSGDGQDSEMDGIDATDVSEHDEDTEDGEMDDADIKKAKAEAKMILTSAQTSTVASLSQAMKEDAAKGRAIKQQRATFDSLLNTRIKLQKAMVAANTLPAITYPNAPIPEAAIRAAEIAAFNLWSSVTALREALLGAQTKAGSKRKRSTAAFTPDTPSAELWSHAKTQEAESQPRRNASLNHWSARTRTATVLSQRGGRINNTGAQPTLVDVLQETLSPPNADRLLKRTQTPRSCAPHHLAKRVPASSDQTIYDDADFYGILLKELLERRSADLATSSHFNTPIDIDFTTRAGRAAKTKKDVDTKASKGRRIRYTVHEKLQNLMAPEDRGTWGGRQAEELFGSLFGRRMGLGGDGDGEGEGEGEEEEEEGLRLFRG
ncbi:rRNA-processing protein bfr2 [Elasticomyces elasticus]|nr:rRNA-processing protein bfr2 [Elasticomyces elasticus]